ncbi:hypothetical protein RLOC_00011330 [Lonchura striata]|uniref:Uncharacterized protein n=1 Tax=Lonchura striata TaxID=40157 RepID=A0A218UFR1_9PASE|nr:hypothetical protein RLOC_00011330 [Lonchura striata domestica]
MELGGFPQELWQLLLLCLKPLENPAAAYGWVIPAAPRVPSYTREEKKKENKKARLCSRLQIWENPVQILSVSPSPTPPLSSAAVFHPGNFFFSGNKA